MHTKDKPNIIELEFVEVKKHIKITFNFAKAFAVQFFVLFGIYIYRQLKLMVNTAI